MSLLWWLVFVTLMILYLKIARLRTLSWVKRGSEFYIELQVLFVIILSIWKRKKNNLIYFGYVLIYLDENCLVKHVVLGGLKKALESPGCATMTIYCMTVSVSLCTSRTGKHLFIMLRCCMSNFSVQVKPLVDL